MKRILVVDDDNELRSHVSDILTGSGYAVDEASSGREAASKAADGNYDVILLDMIMPQGSGTDALVEIRKTAPRTRVVMITAFATIENAVDAMKRGASDFVSKPFKINELLTTIRRVLEESRIEECASAINMDALLSALSNPIRTKVLRIIAAKKSVRLMELARELTIEDHTKVIFHLKILKEAGILAQNEDKSYLLTVEGERAADCLKIIDRHLGQH